MPHINNEPGQYDHTVGAFIVRIDGYEPRILLHMHKKLSRLLPIGGHIELDENPWQAIKHEILEESGYDLKDLTILQPRNLLQKLNGAVVHPFPLVMSSHPFNLEHFHTDTAYGFITTNAPTHKVLHGESADLRWFTKAELLELNEPKIFLNTKEIYLYLLDHCLKNWAKIPTDSFEI